MAARFSSVSGSRSTHSEWVRLSILRPLTVPCELLHGLLARSREVPHGVLVFLHLSGEKGFAVGAEYDLLSRRKRYRQCLLKYQYTVIWRIGKRLTSMIQRINPSLPSRNKVPTRIAICSPQLNFLFLTNSNSAGPLRPMPPGPPLPPASLSPSLS